MDFRFEKKIPHPALRKYVKQYYLFEGPNPGLVNKIPSWTRPVMAIQWRDTTIITVRGNQQRSSPISFNGIITKPYELYTDGRSYHFFTVEFTATGLYMLFRDQISQFVDNSVDACDLIPPNKQWELSEALGEVFDMTDKAKVVDDFLMQFLPSDLADWRIRHSHQVLSLINTHRGDISVKEISNILNLSERHLRRSFHEVMGVSPKKYLRILRFEQSLNQILDEGYAPKLFTEQDYFDQAHFINEFKEFSGFSPKQVDSDQFQFSKFFV